MDIIILPAIIGGLIGFFGMMIVKRFGKNHKRQKVRESYADMLRDDMSDATYELIYKGDKEAIRKAKESWARAGVETIKSTERMFAQLDGNK